MLVRIVLWWGTTQNHFRCNPRPAKIISDATWQQHKSCWRQLGTTNNPFGCNLGPGTLATHMRKSSNQSWPIAFYNKRELNTSTFLSLSSGPWAPGCTLPHPTPPQGDQGIQRMGSRIHNLSESDARQGQQGGCWARASQDMSIWC